MKRKHLHISLTIQSSYRRIQQFRHLTDLISNGANKDLLRCNALGCWCHCHRFHRMSKIVTLGFHRHLWPRVWRNRRSKIVLSHYKLQYVLGILLAMVKQINMRRGKNNTETSIGKKWRSKNKFQPLETHHISQGLTSDIYVPWDWSSGR